MRISRNQFFQLVAGGSAWLVSSGFMQRIKFAAPPLAKPLPLNVVRLNGGPLHHAQIMDATYLLSLEPDRMLSFYRVRAGLEPKAQGLTGWDADGRQLTGHIAGHHLSAISLMWAATGDKRFLDRANYMVSELKSVQDKNGDGFAGALSGVKECFAAVSKGTIRSANFDLNGLWSPWYTLHKTFAGLRDAYRHTGNQTALDVEVKFAAWAETFLKPMDDTLIQRMLATEFGGMNEMMADLYADTGDKRWLDLSYKFEHKAVFEPLRRGEDPLNGLHGNTQVPKAVGLASRYIYAGNTADQAAATFFWDRVVNHHTFATGGHGKDEYFRDPDKLANITEGRTAETCNVYNMLKLTRLLFGMQPDIKYAEFQEQALFNHILGSMDPEDGSTCYMVPVGSSVRREYADMNRSFTCCVGTGQESHALHGLGLYYEQGDKLYVNVYASSGATWESANVKFKMETNFPEGESATMTIYPQAPRDFTLALRRPSWSRDGFGIKINGKSVSNIGQPGSYVDIKRTWTTGDNVEIALPKTIRLQRLADNPKKAVVMWGPMVMAGDLGPAPRNRNDGDGDGVRAAAASAPSIVSDRPVADWLTPVAGKPGFFRTKDVARTPGSTAASAIEFQPFFQIHRRTYGAYFDVLTPAEFAAKVDAQAKEQARVAALDAATLAAISLITEKPFNQQGEETSIVRTDGRPGRRAAKWFSYDLSIQTGDGSREPGVAIAIVATYNTDNRRARSFEILVDGQQVGSESMPMNSESRFVDVRYDVPAALVAGKQKITVRFQATNGNEVAPVFALRTVRL